MQLSDFLIIGAPKCGTTSLHAYLSQHPQLFMSAVKEPHFFAFEHCSPNFNGPGDNQAPLSQNSITQLSEYRHLFKEAKDGMLRGESSTMYLYLNNVPQCIKAHNSEMKLIAILRHPIDRAFSHFLHMRREGREQLESFEEALQAEPQRIAEGWSPAWHYRRVSCYSEQLKRYFQLFEREHLRIYLYEDWRDHPMTTLRDMFTFLEVDNTFQPDIGKKQNISFKPKNVWLYKFLTQPNYLKKMLKDILPASVRKPLATRAYKQNIDRPPVLTTSIRRRLMTEFEADILQLQTLLDLDLTSWLDD
ncbi:sulfotransferase family protein [Leptothoe spongobia]|uniref:Sulfotransferase n=1 Tax=Leptothoe spongobia TAU-MAC 1115 TaxID=1967444 RepID=A0A947DEQ5_9CYAN|nr:sulfotransferase [Leptothoe spongobia]MBT9315560.1 sulfotransferase [Leptothoe spongobia TAU-MAC 1115]